MNLFRFEDPLWLLLLLGIPVLWWWNLTRARPAALRYSHIPDSFGGSARIHWPFIARMLALALAITAIARPQHGTEWEESLSEGIDIQVVLDVSGSMAAEDFRPRNRLHVAQQVVKDFVANRTSDRIGLVAFSGVAVTKAPLTTDRKMVQELVESLELFKLPDGTAIGVALATAANRLKDSDAKSKVAILVTDGGNNAGAIDPGAATAICEGLGIRVYTIGVGSEGKVPVPMPRTDPRTGREEMVHTMLNVEVDEELLRQIAEGTGGHYFEATDSHALERVFAEIDQLETTPVRSRKMSRYREAFPPLAAGALVLMGLPSLFALLGWSVEP